MNSFSDDAFHKKLTEYHFALYYETYFLYVVFMRVVLILWVATALLFCRASKESLTPLPMLQCASLVRGSSEWGTSS